MIPVRTSDGSDCDFTGKEVEIVVDNGEPVTAKIEADGVHMTVSKGPHTFYMPACSDEIPVYANNYSGSGTVTTADGYYHLYFTAEPSVVEVRQAE